MSSTPSDSILETLDSMVPAPLAQFDAFPKLPSSYKSRSESRGFVTLFVFLLAFLMMLNDIGEYIWGWPDHEFSVDKDKSSFMNVNVDILVNMPCRYLSVDLRDAVGDRLFLSGKGLRRDGTKFDVGQATKLKEHSEALSARQVVAQSRSSRGFFDTIFRRGSTEDGFKPTYNHEPHPSACRIWGSLQVKKVTANLHITTLGHGYASHEHVDHTLMNLSHVITEFSYGPHFPDITQPLDNSFEVTHDPFVAYQYFLHVVPTTYIAPRSEPLRTNQYSVTHYTRVLEHGRGTPGIFFKFDLDPISLTIHQRTTTFLQLLIRCVGVIGGVFVCMGYAIRITTRAVEVVTGDQAPVLDTGESSGVKIGLRAKFSGNDLHKRARPGKMVRQGSGWVMEGGESPYASYAGTPVTGQGAFPTSPYPGGMPSPFLSNQAVFPPTPNPGATSFGFGPPPRTPNITSPRTPNVGSGLRTPSLGSTYVPQSVPGTPAAGYATFPVQPSPPTNLAPPPKKVAPEKKRD